MTDSNVPEQTDPWMPSVQDLREYIAVVDEWSEKMSKLVAADSDQRSRRHLWELAVTLWLGLPTGHMVSGTLNVMWTGQMGSRFASVGWSSTSKTRPTRGVDYRWASRPDLSDDDVQIVQHAVTLAAGEADELLNLAGVRPWTPPPTIGRRS